MEKDLIRQGDLLFVSVAEGEIPKHAKQIPTGVLARGEATGHSHRLATLEDAEVLEAFNGMFLRVGPSGVSIVHEEHKPVTLSPGTYVVHRAREYDYVAAAARIVAD